MTVTIGQRVAQKRKELGLSQEGLGEQLGVSRQAIYKWESDAALPEIEKLITLSRVFSVSVGWLLGVEEESVGAEPPEGDELTPEQLKMVEEIVDRYVAALPVSQPEARPRPIWRSLLIAAACLAVVIAFASLFSRLDRAKNDYNNLRWAIDDVNEKVSGQIGSITAQVEEILKSQNMLTADYGTEIAYTDLAENLIAFHAHATPRTYVEGMSAVFYLDCGYGAVEFSSAMSPDRTFSAELKCPLTDSITISVVFIDGDQRETQVLDTYEYLYAQSFPEVYVNNGLLFFAVSGDRLTLRRDDGPVVVDIMSHGSSLEEARIQEMKVGLFRDQELVFWYEPVESQNVILENGVQREEPWIYYRLPVETCELEQGHRYCEAALVTDAYGRQRVYADTLVEEGPGGASFTATDYNGASDPADWKF